MPQARRADGISLWIPAGVYIALDAVGGNDRKRLSGEMLAATLIILTDSLMLEPAVRIELTTC